MDIKTNCTDWNFEPYPHYCAPDSAPLGSCTAELFVGGVTPQADTVVLRPSSSWIAGQLSGSLALIVYLMMCSLYYYLARGQGLLHDRLFSDLDMQPKHVLALLFWLLGTFSTLVEVAATLAYQRIDWARWKVMLVLGCIGGLGTLLVLWKDAFLSVLRKLGSTNEDHVNIPGHQLVFGSMRFDGVIPSMANTLKDALEAVGLTLKIIDMEAGGDIDKEVFRWIEACDTFLVFGSTNYGEDTGNQACTYYEYKHAFAMKKKIILIRMIPWDEQFQEQQARVIFNDNRLALEWQVGADLPSDLPDKIKQAVERHDHVDTAIPSVRSAWSEGEHTNSGGSGNMEHP